MNLVLSSIGCTKILKSLDLDETGCRGFRDREVKYAELTQRSSKVVPLDRKAKKSC